MAERVELNEAEHRLASLICESTWTRDPDTAVKMLTDVITARMADAWDAGMEYGIGEWGAETFASDYERNPYRPKEASDV